MFTKLTPFILLNRIGAHSMVLGQDLTSMTVRIAQFPHGNSLIKAINFGNKCRDEFLVGYSR